MSGSDFPRLAPLESPPPTSNARFWLLLASTAGPFAAASVVRMVRGSRLGDVPFSTARLLALAGTQLLMGAVWLPILARRGWSWRCVTRPFARRDILRALGLVVAGNVAYWVTYAAVAAVDPDFARLAVSSAATGRPTWWAVALVVLVNPPAEELLYLGFVASTLRGEGRGVALAASVCVRFLLHLYQGALAVVSILPLGVVFGWYYLRTGRLWPVVVAHALLDLSAFALLLRGAR